jgi:hypothetical protein
MLSEAVSRRGTWEAAATVSCPAAMQVKFPSVQQSGGTAAGVARYFWEELKGQEKKTWKKLSVSVCLCLSLCLCVSVCLCVCVSVRLPVFLSACHGYFCDGDCFFI